MRITKVMLASLFLISIGLAQELTQTEKKQLEKMNHQYAGDLKSASLDYALLLYRTDEHADHLRADTVVNHYIALQDNDPESITYGQWGWRWKNNKKVVDFNYQKAIHHR